MTALNSVPPRRALRTIDAARYLGVSASLLRKMRSRGIADPLGVGPTYIRLSASLIVYEIAALDCWLEGRARHLAGTALHAPVSKRDELSKGVKRL